MDDYCTFCGRPHSSTLMKRYEHVDRTGPTIYICGDCYQLIDDHEWDELVERIIARDTSRTTDEDEIEFLKKVGIGKVWHEGKDNVETACEYPAWKGELALEVREEVSDGYSKGI